MSPVETNIINKALTKTNYMKVASMRIETQSSLEILHFYE